jgi:hypothetical protein
LIDLREWASRPDVLSRPWLILGKGPSFSRHVDFNLSRFNLLGLNDVVREVKVDVAHAIDIDVAARCAEALRTNCRWLIMPRHPHVDFDPTPKRLENFFDDYPVLRELDRQGRLVWYNLSNSKPIGGAPIITARFFSAEAAFDLLGTVGVRRVRSLGIDGGRGYSRAFEDLENLTMLANTRATFDEQFGEIAQIVDKHGMEYAPLVEPVQPEPMRVFVGADESQLVAARVLEHSIRKHASRPVEFTTLTDLPVPEPKDPANRARTGFSFYRFLIPKLCGYAGRGLYLDCDMQVFADISELWEVPFDGATVLCTNQPEPPEHWKDNPSFKPGRHLAVMTLDCARLQWDIDDIIRGLDEARYGYKELMNDLCIVPDEQIAERIPVEWNSLEHFEPGKTKLVHYTVVPTQPWKTDKNPLAELWMSAYHEAVDAHFIEPELVKASVAAGHIRSSLLDAFEGRSGQKSIEGSKRDLMRVTISKARSQASERLRSVFR